MSSSYSPDCPHRVDRVAMRHRWDSLTFLHWPYDPAVVQDLLPEGLAVETYDGAAWVGLVPFTMLVSRGREGTRPLFEFPETNVRTYVRDPSGLTGVWFFSLDAGSLSAVITARATYRVPYFWSEMSVDRRGETITYVTRRRWPGPHHAASRVEIEIGKRYRAAELGDFDHYLTARWALFGTWGGRVLTAKAEHPRWELHRARAAMWHDELVAAAGLSPPEGEPVVHWSSGVDVNVGYPAFPRSTRAL
ncbi:MAG: YqjF family protein [Acidimicrobiia bacterium]